MNRTKNSRQRGSHTHGWGSKKKHRGAGNRGGRGKAGSGKRGDAKKPSFWKNKSYSGKAKGFKSLKKALKTINISDLGKFDETKINLTEKGFDKLLGTGTPDRKYELTVLFASDSAIQKIKKSGGSVSGLSVKKEPEVKKQAEVKPAPKPKAEDTEEPQDTEASSEE